MDLAVLLVALAVTVLAVTAASERVGAPAPLVLIAVGALGSYLPFVPEIQLHPEVVLLGLLPPLLYSAALQTSLVDFNANRRPILLLSVGLVVFTTVGVAAVVKATLPGTSWPTAIAIGAVVAPPDAVAATAIARRIGLPRRIVTILEGESLLNDATALVALRMAILAASASVSAMTVGLDFLRAAGGGLLVGMAAYALVARLRTHLTDPLLDTAISLVTPFAAYVAAEKVHASGVIAVVVAGLLLGHKAPVLQTAQSRIAERMNWRTIAFLLENAVFLLIGMQARWIIDDVRRLGLPVGTVVLVCVATVIAVVVLRLAWVFPVRYLLVRPGRDSVTGQVPPASYTFIIGWAGMRGVVTLAAAFVIPESTPNRPVLLLVAFAVVAGSLFLQGLTLPWLARRLRVPSPDPAEDALARATLLQQATKAGLAELDRLEPEDVAGVATVIRQRLDQRNFAAWERLGTVADQEAPSERYARLRLAMLAAERSRVLAIRGTGSVASDVVSEVLAMLDVEESMLDIATRDREEFKAVTMAGTGRGEDCEDLRARPVLVGAAAATACPRCLEEGTTWVALRRCLTCGAIGCCDSSAGRHATEHFRQTGHPVMQSAEPGEDWRWCYVHHLTA
jgi:CPA1 family monovalent cation:H+ antiporter